MTPPVSPDPGRTSQRLVQWLHGLAFMLVLLVGGAWFLANPQGPGTVSVVENRKLAEFPTVTWLGLRDGSYTRDIEAFIADHFPLRERLVVVAFALKDARGLRSQTGFVATKGQEDGLENTADWAHVVEASAMDAGEVEASEVDAGEPDGGEADCGVTDAGWSPAPYDLDAGPVRDTTAVREGVLRVGDRGLQLFRGGDVSARAFADTVNAWGQAFEQPHALPDGGRGEVQVSLVVTPTSAAFYLPDDAVGRTLDEPRNLAVMRARLRPSVRMADVYGALLPHRDEAIFFKSDHHWTGLGAYYGYRAFCAASGLEPLELDAFTRKTRPGAPGSLWRMTHDPGLEHADRDVDYFVPPVQVDRSVRFTGDEQKQPVEQPFFVDFERGYLVFFGSDWPVMVAQTQAGTGRRVMLVKNSYGNAFAGYLLSHFDVVVVVDYRYSVRSAQELAKTYGITDVILLNATSTANSTPHVRRLQQVLATAGHAWETEPEKKKREEREQADAGVSDAGEP